MKTGRYIYKAIFCLCFSLNLNADLNLKKGDIVVIRKSSSGEYCSNILGRFICQAKVIDKNEKFLVYSYKNGRLALMSLSNRRFCVETKKGVFCKHLAIGVRGKFIIQSLKSGEIALRGGETGKACIDRKGVFCESLKIGSQERFRLFKLQRKSLKGT